jgi:hypothetical protein
VIRTTGEIGLITIARYPNRHANGDRDGEWQQSSPQRLASRLEQEEQIEVTLIYTFNSQLSKTFLVRQT